MVTMKLLSGLKSARSFYFTSWLKKIICCFKILPLLVLSMRQNVGWNESCNHCSEPSLPFLVEIWQVELSKPLLKRSVVSAKCYKWTWKCNMFCESFRELKVASRFDLLVYLKTTVWASNQTNDHPDWNKETSIFPRSSQQRICEPCLLYLIR